MSEAYNRDFVFNNSSQYLNKDYTVGAKAREEMEKAELARAEEAVKNQAGIFGMLVAEKVKEAGLGPRVAQQVAETAANTLLTLTRPLTQWLDENEKVFDGRINGEFNQFAYQLWSASNLMAAANEETSPILGLERFDEEGNPIKNVVAQKFVMDM